MGEVRSPLSAAEIQRQYKHRKDVVRPPVAGQASTEGKAGEWNIDEQEAQAFLGDSDEEDEERDAA